MLQLYQKTIYFSVPTDYLVIISKEYVCISHFMHMKGMEKLWENHKTQFGKNSL